MIIAKQLRLETWNPPASHWNHLPVLPVWTRLSCDELELSNSIEWGCWESDPVLPNLDDQYWELAWWKVAHLVRTENQLLWLQAYYSENPRFEADDLPYRSIEDSVLIDRVLWDEVCAKFEGLPRFESIRRLTSRDLWTLWQQQLPACVKPEIHSTRSQHFWTKCIASHPLDRELAVPLALQLLEANDHHTNPLEGTLVPIDRERDNIQAFYFDDDETSEWLAFRVEPPHSPVIANQWILRG